MSDDDCVRCAPWTQQQGVDPIGTATAADGFLLIEWALPWPAKIEAIEALAPVFDAAGDARLRVQLVVPPGDRPQRQVVLHRRAPGVPFTALERRVIEAPPADVVTAALRLVRDPASVPVSPPVSDVLICSHGKRDACCGSVGTALAVAMLAAPAPAAGAGEVRVLRTSHTGGHRFAPTALVLPQGTAWAFADAELLEAVVRRSGDVTELLDRYRGCVAFSTPALQAVERAVFGEVGWPWLDWARSGEVLEDGTVRVVGISPEGNEVVWEGRTEPGRTLPVPECRQPLSAAAKSSTEQRVAGLGRLAGAGSRSD
jgi:hypothetical protein